MMRELDAAILRARFDEAAQVIVLAGEGEKFFCAGADIAMLDAATPDFKYEFCLHANETLLRLEHTPKLVIAAIGGHCVGGGLEIALACDLRIARRGRAASAGFRRSKLGVLPGTGGTQRLVAHRRQVARDRADGEGELFDYERGARARASSTRSARPSPAAFLDEVLAYARSFCAPNRAPRAVGRIKRACQTGAEMPLEQGLALERELQQQLFVGDDAKEGIAANLERRDPVFKGR